MGALKHKIENWDHYYKIASSTEGLKDFQTILILNANKPHIDFGSQVIATEEKEVVKTSEGHPTTIRKTVYKTFNQLLKELAPSK